MNGHPDIWVDGECDERLPCKHEIRDLSGTITNARCEEIRKLYTDRSLPVPRHYRGRTIFTGVNPRKISAACQSSVDVGVLYYKYEPSIPGYEIIRAG
jgi:hypothetical protein